MRGYNLLVTWRRRMYALAESLPKTHAVNRCGVLIPLGSSHICMAIAVIVAMLSLTLMYASPPLVVTLSLSDVAPRLSLLFTLGNYYFAPAVCRALS